MKNKTKLCVICGKEFQSKRPEYRCCSHECGYVLRSQSPRQKILPTRCAHCGGKFQPRRQTTKYCSKACYEESRIPQGTEEERFWNHVAKLGDEDCWEWQSTLNDNGYGIGYKDGKRYSAHRAAYEYAIGPIPEGLQLDHLCRNRSCVNPRHLEPVTPKENGLRSENKIWKAHLSNFCKHGHEFTEDNTTYVVNKKGYRERVCRTCRKIALIKHKNKQSQTKEAA